MKHILICGKRNSGKTELFERLLASCRMPLYGFQSGITATREDGFHEIHLFAVGDRERLPAEENLIGICNRSERTVNLPVFETLGVSLLEAKPDGILVMDELGFMEAEAPAFTSAVLRRLDGDIPVLATVRAGDLGSDFLDRVRRHPKADLYTVSPERADALYDELLPVIEEWNEVFQC
jgi:nucleoside-triphosphatase